MNYLWDKECALFRREGYRPIPYSDGPTIEERLLQIIQSASDRTTLSAELAASISDWPSEYHLGRLRHCLLRPVAIKPGDTVLELGCGCGAITRYLGEIGAEVVAVEGSMLRSRVAAERCRDLTNVKIFVDDLLDFRMERRFDWVLLIGVLEYAPAFSCASDPVLHYLDAIRQFLSSTGRLVVAIENRLGLKYFNGCREDHMGVPFFGIQDLYQPRDPQTFGRRELIAKLASAGLPHHYFRYPFPDYKLPTVVLSPASLTDAEFDPVDLLSRCQARDYSGWRYRSFDEALVFASLHKNGLIADLSNSFLVEASATPFSAAEKSELAVTFSVSRLPEYATQTRFLRSGSKIRVVKEHLDKVRRHSATELPITVERLTVRNRLEESEYRPGRQVLWRLLRARAREGHLEVAVQALFPWLEFLLGNARTQGPRPSEERRLASYIIPGDFIDCTPFNLLQSNGELVPIDLEWKSDGDVALGWIVTRGVLWSLCVGLPIDSQLDSVFTVIETLAKHVGLSVSTAEISLWLELEAGFQTLTSGQESKLLQNSATSTGLRSFVSEVASLGRSLLEAQEHNRRMQTNFEGQLHDIVTQREGFQRELFSVGRERDELRAALREARAALVGVRADLGAARAGLRDTSTTLGQTRANLERHAAALRVVEEERERLRQDVFGANLELERRSAQLHAVTGSQTWRLARRLQGIARLNLLRHYGTRRQLQSDKELLSHSTLFDPVSYLENNPDVALAGIDPILHYLLHGGEEGRDPSENFSSSMYLRNNPDVRAAGINPLVHYLRHGAAEGRLAAAVRDSTLPVSDAEEAAKAVSEAVEIDIVAVNSPGVFDYFQAPLEASALPAKVAIGVSSLGNFFMTEIANMIEHALRNLGVTTKLFTELEAREVADFETVLIVAPHEFCHLGQGPAALQVLAATPNLIMFNVEQRHTQWFHVAEQYLPHASAILDINYQTATYLAEAGYRSFFFPLGYSSYIEQTFDITAKLEHEICKHLPAQIREHLPTSYTERPIDILFVGASSPRRKKFFAQHAAYFAAQNCFIYMPDTSSPFLANEPRTLDFATFVALVKRSKLILNIHQNDEPFFEWQRIVNLGIMQQTLVITDHCEPVPCVDANIDYLDGPLEKLPGLCELALHSPKEAERMATHAYTKLKMRYPLENILNKCWSALTRTDRP